MINVALMIQRFYLLCVIELNNKNKYFKYNLMSNITLE